MLSFEMPAMCVVNGHCIAGGIFMALQHDYVIMKDDPKAMWWFNEIDFGFIIPEGLIRLVEFKVDTPQGYQLLMLGKKIRSKEALKVGIVDGLYRDEEDLHK